ncbi:21245_t:CDS:2 [Cetraspora pellucida]|uniref:21245_t:CDS:1 n=1 Tax=Cetraspora pellucida TaxID=1433469 RepID=A0A9N8Z2G8_9GLOM|nr:21245_t:CDS:2 [Cetraspora pellucida]
MSYNRKNRKRKHTDRKAYGRRADAIIRKNTNGWILEFGGMLRDMFIGLCNNPTIGYIHGNNPAGYIMRLTKSEFFEILEDIEYFALGLELIGAVFENPKKIKLVQEILLDLKQLD